MQTKEVDFHNDERVDLMVRKLFNPETDLHQEFQHLQYIGIINDDNCAEQIVTQLRQLYLEEIIHFGHDAFK